MRFLPVLFLVLPLWGQQYRAFWADAFHPGYKNAAQIDQMVEDVATAKGNAILMEVRNRGGSYFLKSIEPLVEDAEWSPSFDALQYLIEKAHARGIEVHAWYPVTPLWPLTRAPLDPKHAWNLHGPKASGDDFWMTQTAGGKISTSVDPGHPDAARYLAEVILDPVRNYDLDGIHLDYIRYPEDDDYGWNPKAVERFQRLKNKSGTPSARDADWAQFRRDQVTALVRQVYLRAAEMKPSLKVSGALITWGDGPATDAQFRTKDAYSRVFQDRRGWLEEGILDIGMPMNYFRQATNSGFLDRWIAFEKDRQYRRSVVVGVANYLNTIPESMAQLQRVQAASTAGIVFYSYASTNTLNDAGLPVIPNSEFYKAIGGAFKDTATVAVMPWKRERGHVLGTVQVDGAAAWLKDGVSVIVESDTGRDLSLRTTTDGTGFFGAVDLMPDRYRIRLERGGLELFRTVAQDVAAGSAARFDIFLKAEDFAGVLPRIHGIQEEAAPGELIEISGDRLASKFAVGGVVPMLSELDGTQVLVNGAVAPLSYVSPERIEFQVPFDRATQLAVSVRRAGMESQVATIAAVPVRPVILGVRRTADRYLEIYATGLGAVTPAIPAGQGGNSQEPFQRIAAPVTASIGRILYAGLSPYQPYRYQINVELPEGATSGVLELRIADRTVQVEF